ncbi:MAG: peptidase M61, partial [Burkholderiaceae bacterium]
MNDTIRYQVVLHDPAAHLFAIRLTLAAPDPGGQLFRLPAWIPGSYMVRDFARNIVRIRAEAGGRPVALSKLDKHSWQAAPCAGPLTLQYEVYAWDLSVRAAHFDQTHAFFNGSSLFLRAVGHEDAPHVV